MNLKRLTFLFLGLAPVLLFSCGKDDDGKAVPGPTPYSLEIPKSFPKVEGHIPDDNPLTNEGVELGRHLFYDKRLSHTNSISCGSCHKQEFAFADGGVALSTGFDGAIKGTRNAMSLTNILWSRTLNWDGSASTLEQQAVTPLTAHIEMNQPLDVTVSKLQNTELYPKMFEQAFGSRTITKENVLKALAQFQRTLISGNSKFDKWQRGEITEMTALELEGYRLFYTHTPYRPSTGKGANCFDCHGGKLFTLDSLFNNGLDATFTDLGRGGFTKQAKDNGLFKTPTLRNIALTAPYMHDGRFNTLREVLQHYNNGVQFNSPNLSAHMRDGYQYQFEPHGGLQLDDNEIAALEAFLKALTDEEFIKDPRFSDPFKK